MIVNKNENYIVCKKVVGISSQNTDSGNDMPHLISEQISHDVDSVYPVHRLDNAVGGTIVYALKKQSAAKLSALVSDGKMDKEYLAVIHGKPEEDAGILEDMLFKDSSKNKSYVVKRMRKGVKKASLEYRVLANATHNEQVMSLVWIKLHTGRTHQIRVQFSSRKMPLVGDRRYGSGKDECTVALWSHRVSFASPFDGNDVSYVTYPDEDVFPWNLFDKSVIDN